MMWCEHVVTWFLDRIVAQDFTELDLVFLAQIASMIEIEVEMDIDVLAAEGAGAAVSYSCITHKFH